MTNDFISSILSGDRRAIAKAISMIENEDSKISNIISEIYPKTGNAFVIGITGPPGTGKSTLINRLIENYRKLDKKIGVILGLTHLINIAFANILAKDDQISLTEKMAGTTFKAQRIIAESILTESAELIETIVSNPEVRRSGEEFWKDIGRLLTNSQEGKSEETINYIKSSQEKISKNVDLEKSNKKLAAMIKTVEK